VQAAAYSHLHTGSSLSDLSTLKMEAILSSETSVNTRTAQRHIPEDDILQTSKCFKVFSETSSLSFVS
jgi:hypothetical protein